MNDKKEDIKRIQIVYAGRYKPSKEKGFWYRYVHIDKIRGDLNESSMAFGNKLLQTVIGAIIEVTKTEDGVAGPYKYIGFLNDQDIVAKWIALDEAIYMEEAAKRNMKKVPKNTYDDAVQSLQDIYRYLTPSQREMFLWKLNQKIRSRK